MTKKNETPSVGENIRKYRKIRGLTQKQLAAEIKKLTGKGTQQTIHNIENGTITSSHLVPYIAIVLNVDAGVLDPYLAENKNTYIATDVGTYQPSQTDNEHLSLYQIAEIKRQAAISTQNNSIFDTFKNKTLTLTNDIPIYGTIDIVNDGFYITNTPIDFITRPQVVKLESEAFGIILGVRNMEPAFRIDDTIIVHPRKLAKTGDVCLFQNNNYYTIGELVEETYTDWVIKQYNVNSKKTLPKETWKKCYIVVARFL